MNVGLICALLQICAQEFIEQNETYVERFWLRLVEDGTHVEGRTWVELRVLLEV